MEKMPRREFIQKAALSSAAAAATLNLADQSDAGRTPAKRPNIVLILTDEERWDTIAVNGNPVIKTPNLDRLSHEGVRFDHMFVAAYPCSPSRGSLLTGLYPEWHGVIGNDIKLPEFVPTIGTVLRDAGYDTAWMGKWHIGGGCYNDKDDNGKTVEWIEGAPELSKADLSVDLPKEDRAQNGFEHWVSPVEDYIQYIKDVGVWDRVLNAEKRIRGNHVNAPIGDDTPKGNCGTTDIPEEHCIEAFLTDRAVDYLEGRQSEKPFCLCLSLPGPHSPVNPPRPYNTMYKCEDMPLPKSLGPEPEELTPISEQKTKKQMRPHWTDLQFQSYISHYYGFVSYIDKQVGKVIDSLDKTGLAENTIVIFTSDHGDHAASHGYILKTEECFDELYKVPFIMRAPILSNRQDKVVDALASQIDLLPTLLDMVGVPGPSHLHGTSFLPLLMGEENSYRDAVFACMTGRRRLVRTAEWKLAGLGSADRKYSLYNMKEDPDEMSNLISDASCKDIIADLKKADKYFFASRSTTEWIEKSKIESTQ